MTCRDKISQTFNKVLLTFDQYRLKKFSVLYSGLINTERVF